MWVEASSYNMENCHFVRFADIIKKSDVDSSDDLIHNGPGEILTVSLRQYLNEPSVVIPRTKPSFM